MKANSYIRFFALAGLAVAATACDENSWNDHLDGFDEFENKPTTQVETVEYTLTDADYGTIAGLSENIALAGTEGAKALKAVGDQKRFSEAAVPTCMFRHIWQAQASLILRSTTARL